MTHKNGLSRHIYERRSRIEKYRLRYGENSKRFKKLEKNNLSAIKRLQNAHDQLDIGDKLSRELAKNVVDFLGENRQKGPIHQKLTKEGKRLFYRWGLENGFPGTALHRYIGLKSECGSAAKVRKNHMASCKVETEVREQWNQFNLYMQDL